MKSFTQFLAEAKGKYYYHVTFTSKVKKIMREGIKPLQTSNWVKGMGGDRYNEEGGIFAFEHPFDAARWAFKQNWEFKKPVSIIRIKPTNQWYEDPSEDYSLTSGKGKALKSMEMVKPSDLVDAKEFKGPADLGTNVAGWEEAVTKYMTEDVEELNEILKQQDGEWVLVSKKSGRVLRKYGKEKPSEEAVAQDEREIQYFKHQK